MNLASIDLMFAKVAPPFSKEGWIFEFKYDGHRTLASKEQLLTRNKIDATRRYPEIFQALHGISGSFVLDGEICLLDEHGIPDFEALQGRKRGQLVTYFAFDLLFLNGRDLRESPLLERKKRLKKLIPKEHARIRYVDFIKTQGEAMFRHAARIGLEGVLGKRVDSPYKGGLSRDWLKAKVAGFHDGLRRLDGNGGEQRR